MERVELYLYPPCGPHRTSNGITFLLPLNTHTHTTWPSKPQSTAVQNISSCSSVGFPWTRLETFCWDDCGELFHLLLHLLFLFKEWPLRPFMTFGKGQKSHVVRCGEYSACCGGGWRFVLRQKKNCWSAIQAWQNTLSALFVSFFLSLEKFLFIPYETPSVLAARTNFTLPTDITIVPTLARILCRFLTFLDGWPLHSSNSSNSGLFLNGFYQS